MKSLGKPWIQGWGLPIKSKMKRAPTELGALVRDRVGLELQLCESIWRRFPDRWPQGRPR